MSILRLLGVGVLFAVAIPQHGGARWNEPTDGGSARYGDNAGADRSAPPALAARGVRSGGERGSAVFAAESPRLRALRTNETDLFKNLPDAPRSCEGSACSPEPAARDRVAQSEPERAEEDPSWLANLRRPEIPVRAHERVRQYLDYFTQNSDGRRVFRTWLKRSGRYSKTVSGTLRELLLPQDLQAVVFVESGYSPKAVSTAGAVGLWQLMASTARIYGLAVENDFDERRSVERASQAAVRHLSDMRDRFGSWDLALAAYNMGYKALVDRIKDVSTNDFWTLSELEGVLPRETQLYVPKVLAAAVILRNLDRFGFDDVRTDAPVATADLECPPGTNIAIVARAAGTSTKVIRELNPELLSEIVPDRARTLGIHIPSSGMARAQSLLPRLLDRRDRDGLEDGAGEDFDWGKDELPRRSARRRVEAYDGDRFADRSSDFPEPRRSARVPRIFGSHDADEEPSSKGNVILYRVGESESVGSIARAFGTSSSQIIEDNYLDPDGKLQRGMLLMVEVSSRSMQRLMKKRAQSRIDRADGIAPESEDGPRLSPGSQGGSQGGSQAGSQGRTPSTFPRDPSDMRLSGSRG